VIFKRVFIKEGRKEGWKSARIDKKGMVIDLEG